MKLNHVLFLIILGFVGLSCTTDTITNENETTSTNLTERNSSTVEMYITVEWEPETSLMERYLIRQDYMESGYLIEHIRCLRNFNKEIWLINHCLDCQPFHDPGDTAKINSANFNSKNCD